MESASSELQKQREKEAHRQYSQWLESMTPEELKEMEAKGLLAPDISCQASHSFRDVSELQISAPPTTFTERLEDVLAEDHGLTAKQAESIAMWHRGVVEKEGIQHKAHLLSRIVGFLMLPGNIQVRAFALAFATNLKLLDGIKNQSDAARMLKVSRAALSKVVKQWQRELDLPCNEHNKSQAACEQYSKVQQQNHWRRDRKGRIKKLFSRSTNNQGGKNANSNQEESRKASAAV